MTVIAWDGKTLAADKRATCQGLARTTTKIFRVGDALVGFSGDASHGNAMLAWARAGFDPATLPDAQKTDDYADFVVIRDGRVFKYERGAHPFELHDQTFAMGSGRDYAVAAMYLGKTSLEAVALACVFDLGCGNGIDTLEL